MALKFDRLNLWKLFQEWSDADFKRFVIKMAKRSDLEELIKARYGIQAGMSQMAEKKICHDSHVQRFIKWQRIVEEGIRVVYRKKYPNPLDNPANRNNPLIDQDAALKAKRNRDQALEVILKKYSF